MNTFPSVVSFIREFRSGSSLPLLVEADDGKKYMVKLSGSGDGISALASEWIASHLAALTGIPVLQPVILNFDHTIMPRGIDPEISELAERSRGLNLATEYIADTRTLTREDIASVPKDVQSTIFLTDLLLLNIDRTPKNSNILLSGGNIFCFDYSSGFTVSNILSGTPLMDNRIIELMRRHIFYSGNISDEHITAQIPSFSKADIHNIIEGIPDEWRSRLPCEKIETALYTELNNLAQIKDWLNIVHAAKYESDEDIRIKNRKVRKAFFEKHGGM